MSQRGLIGKRIGAAAVLSAVIWTAVGCGQETPPAADTAVPASAQVQPQSSAISVNVTTPTIGSLSRETEFVGRIEAAESIKVYPDTQGKILKTYFRSGDYVQAGQLMFELDTEDLQTNVDLAYLQYQAAVSNAASSLDNAEQQMRTTARSLYNAEKDLEDLEDDNSDTVSALRSARNDARKNLNELQSQLDEAKKELEALKNQGSAADEPAAQAADEGETGTAGEEPEQQGPSGDIAALEEKVEQLTKDVQTAQVAYDSAEAAYQSGADTADRAEGDSRVNRTNLEIQAEYAQKAYERIRGDAETGAGGIYANTIQQAKINYENALESLEDAKVYAPVSGTITAKNASESEMASSQSPVYVISSSEEDPVVTFHVSEDGANAISVGSTVTVIYNGREFEARVIELANEADAATGLYSAKAQPLQDLGTERTGAAVKVKTSTAKADNALLLPLDVIEYDENQPYVYIYRDGKAVRADLTTGMSTADSIVIESGLSASDQIITTWHPDLKDGAAVALYSEENSQSTAPEGEGQPASGQSEIAPEQEQGTLDPGAASAPGAEGAAQ